MAVYLAIDLGTTGCRSILFDGALNELASSYQEYGLITPKAKFVEQDAELWWQLTLKTAKDAIAKSGISAKGIDGISISSQGITIVPVDENVMPVYNAISWLDTRSDKQAKQMEDDFGFDEIFKVTGRFIGGGYTLPTILWIKENLPEIYKSTYKFLLPLDFLTAKLTGKFVTDYSMATGTTMFNIKSLCWCDEYLDKYGVDKNLLPSVLPAGSVIGNVLPGVAAELGLKDSCVVSLGAQDQKCAAFGVGLREGVMTISLGTAAAVTKLWDAPKTEINDGVAWCGYINDKNFVTEGVVDTAGTCLRWVRDIFYKSEGYAVIDKEAEEVMDINAASPLFFYPFLNGGAPLGNCSEATGTFYGVNLATVRGNFALAVMEGVAYQIRSILEAMKAYENVDTMVIFGGVAKSRLWCQIIADITGMKINVPENLEAASAGAARLASIGCGNDVGPLKYGKCYTPSDKKDIYNKNYLKYKEIERKMWEIK